MQVNDVTYRGFNGTCAGDVAIDLDCMDCFNIVLDQINIVSSQKTNKVSAICKNFHGKIDDSVVPKVSCK